MITFIICVILVVAVTLVGIEFYLNDPRTPPPTCNCNKWGICDECFYELYPEEKDNKD